MTPPMNRQKCVRSKSYTLIYAYTANTRHILLSGYFRLVNLPAVVVTGLDSGRNEDQIIILSTLKHILRRNTFFKPYLIFNFIVLNMFSMIFNLYLS